MVVLFAGLLSSGVGGSSLLQDEQPDPTVDLKLNDERIEETNSTSFLLHVGNPPSSERPMYLMVILRVDVSSGGLTVFVDDDRAKQFGSEIIWRANFDLEPGEYRLVPGRIDSYANPADYSFETEVNYWEDNDLVTRSVTSQLTVEPDDSTHWLIIFFRRLLRWAGTLFTTNLAFVGALVALLALLVDFVEGNRTWRSVQWLWSKSTGWLDRVTHWVWSDDRE